MLGNDLAQISKGSSDTFAAFNMAEGPPPADCSKESIISNGSIISRLKRKLSNEESVQPYRKFIVAQKGSECGLDRTCAPYPMNVKVSPDGTSFLGKFSMSLGSLFRAIGVTGGVTDLLSCMIPTSNPLLGSPAHI